MRFLSVLCITIIQLAIAQRSNETTAIPFDDDANVTIPVTTIQRDTTTIPTTIKPEEVPTGKVVMKDCDEDNHPIISFGELMESRTAGTVYVCNNNKVVEEEEEEEEEEDSEFGSDLQLVSTKNEEYITTKTRTVIKTSRNGVITTTVSSETTTKSIDEETIVENGETTTTIDELTDTVRTNEVSTTIPPREEIEEKDDIVIDISLDNRSNRTLQASVDLHEKRPVSKRSAEKKCVKINGYCVKSVNGLGLPDVESVEPEEKVEKVECVQGETHCISAVNGHGMPNVVSVKTTTEKAEEENATE